MFEIAHFPGPSRVAVYKSAHKTTAVMVLAAIRPGPPTCQEGQLSARPKHVRNKQCNVPGGCLDAPISMFYGDLHDQESFESSGRILWPSRQLRRSGSG